MSKNLNMNGKNITAVFGGAALLTLIGGGAVIFVMNGRINAERTQEVNLEAQVGSSEQVAKKLQVTQADYDLTRSKIAMLEVPLPQKSYVPTLLQQLQTLAASTNLFVSSVQPGQIITPAPPAATTTASGSSSSKTKAAATLPYNTMDVTLSVTGTYLDTQKFVYGLTHFPKIISVTGIQMSPASSSTSASAASTSVTTSLKLTAFIFPDTGPDSTPASAGAATSVSAGVVPAVAAPTPAGAAGRAMQGAVAATHAANASDTMPAHTL